MCVYINIFKVKHRKNLARRYFSIKNVSSEGYIVNYSSLSLLFLQKCLYYFHGQKKSIIHNKMFTYVTWMYTGVDQCEGPACLGQF